MQRNYYVIGIIIIIIIIIAVLLWFFLNNNSEKKINTNNEMSILEKSTNFNLKKSVEKRIHKRGLYSFCVLGDDRNGCQDGLICDDGMCKQSSGTSCVISSSCNSKDICYIGKCTPQPSTKDEFEKTNYGGGRICVNRHFLKLQDTSFIMLTGWWSLNGGIYICDSDVTGLVYVAREEGIFRISIDPIISGITEINQNLPVSKIFRFLEKIYVLTTNGILYQLLNETITSKWKYSQVTEIYKKELTSFTIEDIYPCKDGSISIKISGKIFSYSTKEKEWIKEKYNPIKIVYGDSVSNKIILYKDKIDYYFNIKNNEVKISSNESSHSNKKKEKNNIIKVKYDLKGSFKDIEFNPNKDAIIAISSSNSSVKEYKPVVWLPFISGQSHFKEIPIKGFGDRLIRTKDTIWILTGATCTSI